MPEPVTDPVQPNNDPVAVVDTVTPPVIADPVTPPVVTPPVAPEKYELTMPKDSLLEPSTIEKISAYAKEKGLSNEAAQEILDRENSAVQTYHENQNKQVEEIRASWIKSAEADKEVGGKDFKQNVELAKRVIDKFGSEEFKTALNETGFGNHPEVVRTFVRIGKMMADDEMVFSKAQPSTGTKSNADVFYNNTKTEE